jgi:diacylglycerol kinase family enzyme
LAKGLSDIGIKAHILSVAPGGADPDGWRRDLGRLMAHGLDYAFVLGGDGTVLTVATVVLGHDIPLGIIPLGTANLLARDLGLPLEPEAALDGLVEGLVEGLAEGLAGGLSDGVRTAQVGGNVRHIDVGRVNGHPFLCASMLGMTTELAKAREAARGLGTWRLLPRLVRKGYWLLKRYPFRSVTLCFDDDQLSVSTRAMIVTNNPLRAEPGLYPSRARLDRGVLGIYGVHEGPLSALPRLALSLIAGTWPSEPRVFNRTAHRVTIDTRKSRRINALNDGEPVRLRTPLHYDILTHALPVLMPLPEPVRARGQET